MRRGTYVFTVISLCLLLMNFTAEIARTEGENHAIKTVETFLESLNQGDLDTVVELLAPDMVYVYEEEGEMVFQVHDPEIVFLVFEEMVLLDSCFMVEELEYMGHGVVKVKGRLKNALTPMRLPEYEEGILFTTLLTVTESSIEKMVLEQDPEALELYDKRERGSIGVWVNWENDHIVFIDVLEGSSADRAGVEIGDRLIAVDGQLVTGIRPVLAKVVAYIRGEPGTMVSLTIERRGEILEMEIEREIVDHGDPLE